MSSKGRIDLPKGGTPVRTQRGLVSIIWRGTGALLTLLIFSSLTRGATWVVDPSGAGDFLAIAPALAAAGNGDSVLVVPGVYTGNQNKNLDFGGRGIALLAIGGADLTVIDGQGSGRAFHFHSGEPPSAIVGGFRITRAPTGSPVRIAAGSRPTIRDCVIEDNHVTSGPGGGVAIIASAPAFVRCAIVQNSSSAHGGGVYIEGGAPVFIDCFVVGNRTEGRGGGFWVNNGANLSLSRCTVTANQADQSDAGFNGGGIILTGGSTASLQASILWGNRASNGDDAFIDGTSTLQAECSVVDVSGLQGPGGFEPGPHISQVEPHFCLPSYNFEQPWTDGDYTLGANSPCLPGNNPCGVRIGAAGADCGDIAVWTGAAGTTAWENPFNWAGQALPGPDDHVQLTRGNVVLSSEAAIALLTQVPEAGMDTFLVSGGSLQVGGSPDGPRPGTKVQESTTISGNTGVENGGDASSAGNLDHRLEWIIRYAGRLRLNGGSLSGYGLFTVDGEFESDGSSGVGPYVEINNRGGGSPPNHPLGNRENRSLAADGSRARGGGRAGGPGLRIAGGVFDLRGGLTNGGEAFVEAGAELRNTGRIRLQPGSTTGNDGVIQNEAGATLEVSADLEGMGQLYNLGIIRRQGAGAASISSPVYNDFDPASGRAGLIDVLSGTLATGPLYNSGRIVTRDGTVLSAALLDNGFHGLLEGAGTYTSSTLATTGTISPGSSPGRLNVQGDVAIGPSGRLDLEIGGAAPGSGYDQVAIQGGFSTSGALYVELLGGFTPQVGDSFRVVTVSPPAPSPGAFGCFSGIQIEGGPFLLPVVGPDGVLLVATGTAPDNQPPLAVTDQQTVTPGIPAVLTPLENDTDPEGAPLRLVSVTVPEHGVAWINDDQTTVTYVPDAGYAGGDLLGYVATDCAGASAAGLIYLGVGTSAVDGRTEAEGPSPEPPPLLTGAGTPRLAAAPNPSTGPTRLRFSMPGPGPVRLLITDAAGRTVATLTADSDRAGVHELDWDGKGASGRPVAPGVYFVRLRTSDGPKSEKLIVVR